MRGKFRTIELSDAQQQAFWQTLAGSGDACWEWPERRNRRGYGIFRKLLTHRISFTLTHGPIPEGLVICHKCDNTSCCNPDHLFMGTLADNARDMCLKKRNRFSTHPEQVPRGEDNKNAKLTEDGVRRIFQLHRGGTTIKMISSEMGMHYNTVRRIIQRKLWAHVEL